MLYHVHLCYSVQCDKNECIMAQIICFSLKQITNFTYIIMRLLS